MEGWGSSSGAQSLGNGGKSRTSAAKAAHDRRIYGTAEAVPFVQKEFFRSLFSP
jgi:hypothetical protein